MILNLLYVTHWKYLRMERGYERNCRKLGLASDKHLTLKLPEELLILEPRIRITKPNLTRPKIT